MNQTQRKYALQRAEEIHRAKSQEIAVSFANRAENQTRPNVYPSYRNLGDVILGFIGEGPLVEPVNREDLIARCRSGAIAFSGLNQHFKAINQTEIDEVNAHNNAIAARRITELGPRIASLNVEFGRVRDAIMLGESSVAQSALAMFENATF